MHAYLRYIMYSLVRNELPTNYERIILYCILSERNEGKSELINFGFGWTDGWMVGCLVGWTLELWSFVVCSFLQIFSSIVSSPILSYVTCYMYSVSTYFTRRERERTQVFFNS